MNRLLLRDVLDDVVLRDIVESRAGKTPSRSDPTLWGGDVPWLTAKDLKTHRLSSSIERITSKAVERGAPLAIPGDVLILVRGMTLLKDVPVGVVEAPVSYNQDVRCLRPQHGYSGEYLAYLLGAAKDRILGLVTQAGHGTGRLDGEQLMSVPLRVPPKGVQNWIVERLQAADAVVDKLDRLLAAKRELKRGLLQQLLTGRQRFPEFAEGPWSLRPLGELAAINPEALPSGTDPEYVFRYIDLGSVDSGQLTEPRQSIRFADAPSRARRIVRQHDVLFSTVRPYLKGFALMDGDVNNVVCSTGFAVLRTGCSNDARFLFEFLFSDDVARQAQAMLVGSNYPALNERDVARIKIPWPSAEERAAIGEILYLARQEVTLLEAQRAQIELLKHGLMQKLLSGELVIPADAPDA